MEIRHETERRVLLSCPRVQRSHICVLYFRHHIYIEKRKRSTDGTLSEWCEKEQNNTININICETRFLNFSFMVFTFYRYQNTFFFVDINYVLNIILHDRNKYRKKNFQLGKKLIIEMENRFVKLLKRRWRSYAR